MNSTRPTKVFELVKNAFPYMTDADLINRVYLPLLMILAQEPEDRKAEMDKFLQDVAANHQAYDKETVVVKFGGEIYDDKEKLDKLLRQVRILQVFGARVVLVHGGAKQINALYAQRGLEKITQGGERMCTLDGLEASYDALNTVNKDIVRLYNQLGGAGKFEAVGLGAYQEGMVKARVKWDNYYTGTDAQANTLKLKLALESNPHRIFVIHPICALADNDNDDLKRKYPVLNVNADYVAAALAVSLRAKRLILCTNAPGIIDTRLPLPAHIKQFSDEDPRLIPFITPSEIQPLIDCGVIDDGMEPKVRSLIYAVMNGVEGAVIVNPSKMGLELFSGNGAGTLLMPDGTPRPIPPQTGLKLAA